MKDKKHIHIPLEKIKGHMTVSPDLSPELINALNIMAQKAYNMSDDDKQQPTKRPIPLEMQGFIISLQTHQPSVNYGIAIGGEAVYRMMQEVVDMHLEVLEAAVTTTDKLREEIRIITEEREAQKPRKQ